MLSNFVNHCCGQLCLPRFKPQLREYHFRIVTLYYYLFFYFHVEGKITITSCPLSPMSSNEATDPAETKVLATLTLACEKNPGNA